MQTPHACFLPLILALLLGSGAASSHAETGEATVTAVSHGLEPGDDDLHDDDDDLALDADGEYDPAEHLRRQLARQSAPTGSGGPAQACMITGRITVLGMNEEARDCMQSKSRYSVAEFRRSCEGLAKGLTGLGNAPASVDYIGSCPTPAQGSCRNFMGTGLDAFYYQRRPDDVASLPNACALAGGSWVPTR